MSTPHVHSPPGEWSAHCISTEACRTHARKEKTPIRSIRMTTLGLSVAILGLLAHLVLAETADNVSSLVRQGAVITVDARDQATL